MVPADEPLLRADCPTHRLLGVIGDRWSILVLIALHDGGPLRSAQLKRAVEGISQKVLTQCVRRLEQHRLVHRDVEPTVPVSVTYSLTGLGAELYEVVAPVRAWAELRFDDSDSPASS